jgi:undecaprenyl-diphosphatase
VSEALSILEAVLLGAIQGLTEWLPVSSSGHLVLAQQFLEVPEAIFFDLLLHVATLGVILAFYRDTVTKVLQAIWDAPKAHLEGLGLAEVWWQDPDRRLAVLVVLGSIPTAIVGFGFEDTFERLFESPLAVGVALLATGTWLFLARFAPEPDPERPTAVDALLVGLSQGLAITPGVSRSGATIGTSLLRGIEREHAVRFSFLLSVPAIAGAAIFRADPTNVSAALANWPAYVAGIAVAVLVGYTALWLLVQLVERRGFTSFCWYCWAVGGLTIALAL